MIKDAEYETARVERCVAQLLSLRNRPTAIVAGDDIMASDALRFLREKGIEVPGEMSLAGCNDMPVAQQVHPPLTTVQVPMYRLGQIAARTLVEEVEEGMEESEVILKPKLVIRDSTGPLRGANNLSENQLRRPRTAWCSRFSLHIAPLRSEFRVFRQTPGLCV